MLYDYKCNKCGDEVEAVNKIDERRTNAPICCNYQMALIIKQAPMGFMDREVHYICPVTNKGVTTRRQRNEIMAREGLVDANDLKQSHKDRKKERQTHLDIVNQPQVPKDLAESMGREFKKEQNKFLDSVG